MKKIIVALLLVATLSGCFAPTPQSTSSDTSAATSSKVNEEVEKLEKHFIIRISCQQKSQEQQALL